MKINEVIERHGMQLRDVSREMGMKPSALQSAIDRNLTVKTLRQISEAARIPIAEFFFDELTDDERQQLLATLQPSAQGGQEKEEQGDGLPFSSGQPSDIAHQSSGQPSVQMQQAIICPHCKKAMTITVQA